MLSYLLNYAKKVLIMLLMAAMLLSGFSNNSHAYTINDNNNTDVVIRAGEWANETTAKPGKRYVWGTDINISEHGLTAKDIPTDIPLRKGEDGNFYISEADINLKTAKALAKKLDEKGIKVDLQYATSKSGDLNAAGRIAAAKNPKIYLSIHHNSYQLDSRGYFFMSNVGDNKSAEVAKRLSDSMINNYVPQMSNRLNENSYIGELNKVAASGRISILGELGFFSNPEELKHIMSDGYVEEVTTKLANEIYDVLQNTKDTFKVAENTNIQAKTIGIKNKNYETGVYRVLDESLNIRKGPGLAYDVVEEITDKGSYTVIEVNNGWGRLASGKGWISLKGGYTELAYTVDAPIVLSFAD